MSERPFKFLVSGKDYTLYVNSITNDIQEGSLGNTSTVTLRADSAEGNQELLREFLVHSNNNAAAKVYLRGFYDPALLLRMSGKIQGGISGTDPFNGFSVVISNPAASSDDPAAQGADTSGNPLGNQSVIEGEKTVSEIATELIKRGGWKLGKVDVFLQRVENFYPLGRTYEEQLYQLADRFAAKVTMRPASAKVVNGEIRVEGVFDIPVPDDGSDDPAKAKPKDRVVFKLTDLSGKDFSVTDFEDDREIMGQQLTPLPPGATVDEKGKVTAKQLSQDLEEAKNKNTFEQELLRQQLEEQNPEILALLSKATPLYYGVIEDVTNPDTQEVTTVTKYLPAVTLVDNDGRRVKVPLAVAAASLKDSMVVDFVMDSPASALPEAGYILTRKTGPLAYPTLRIKSFGGFTYAPPSITERLPAAPGGEGNSGAVIKDKAVQAVKVNKEQTIAELAESYPDLFRKVEVTQGGKTQTLYLAYDDDLYQRTKGGVLFPTNTERGTNEDGKPGELGKPLTYDEFEAMPTEAVLTLWLKRRAALAQQGAGEGLLPLDAPELLDKEGKVIPTAGSDPVTDLLAAERQNNKYLDPGGDNGYDTALPIPPVYAGNEKVSKLLGDGQENLYLAGKPVQVREDGKTNTFRARSIVMDAAVGAKLAGEITQDTPTNFNMTVTIDLACGKLLPGFVISCDETCGPLMGSYTISGLTETMNGSQATSVLELTTKRLLDGYGDSINGRVSDSVGGLAVDASGVPLAATPENAAQFKAQGVSILGLSINMMVRQALTAPWATDESGYCSRFVRQVVDRTVGAATGLYGVNAIATGSLMRGAGLVVSLESLGGVSGLRPGDVILQEFGSALNGVEQGHIGIYGGDGRIYENSWSLPYPHKGSRPVSGWGRITGVMPAALLQQAIESGRIPGRVPK